MYVKLESGSLRRDAWEGEDVEYSNVKVKKSERLAKKKPSKSKLAANSTEQAGALGDCKKEEVIVKTKEKRHSFKQAGSQKKVKEGKEKAEMNREKLEQIRNYALQRRDKTKRRRKRETRSKHKVKKEDVSVEDGLDEKHARVEKMAVVRSNPEWTLGHFPIYKERENAR